MKDRASKPLTAHSKTAHLKLESSYHSRIRKLQISLAVLGASSILSGGLFVLWSHSLIDLNPSYGARTFHMIGLLLLTLSVLPLARLLRR